MRALLDVNVLIALMDEKHDFHERAHRWWQANLSRKPKRNRPMRKNRQTIFRLRKTTSRSSPWHAITQREPGQRNRSPLCACWSSATKDFPCPTHTPKTSKRRAPSPGLSQWERRWSNPPRPSHPHPGPLPEGEGGTERD